MPWVGSAMSAVTLSSIFYDGDYDEALSLCLKVCPPPGFWESKAT